jgi:DNA-directed RNA polymerase subunit RPC12/RpoP
MAMVKCSECGKQISSKVKKCPHCGYRQKQKITINKKLIIGLLIVFVLGVGVFIAYNNRPLNSTEKKVVLVLNDYKPRLKNPSSIQVFDIRCTESYDNDNNLKLDVYVDTSGQNGFGGNTRDIIYYTVDSNNKVEFVGTDSKASYSISTYTSKSDEAEIKLARSINKSWEELKNDDGSKVNVKKVMKRVK